MKKLKLQVLLVPIHLASIATDSLDNLQTKRFLHLADPSDDLNKIEKDVQARYRKLYPDEQELHIEKFQDNDLCDLDLDYGVDDVFQSGDLVRVIIFNDFSRYSIDNTSFSMAKRIEYPNSTNLELAQSTPKPPAAPTLINNPNISRLERTNEYFDQYTGRIPNKSDIPKTRTPNMNIGKIRVQSPKLPTINVDPNLSLPPPEDNYNNAIPTKHHADINESASPGTQKRITSGMLNLPPHAKLEKEEIQISQNTLHEKNVRYSEDDLNSSSEAEGKESSPMEQPKSVAAGDLLTDKDQLVTVSKLNDSFVSASSSKRSPSYSNMSSDDDDSGVRREAARYKDPSKQHYVISKDEVIDIFKHRIVRANKQMNNGDGKDKFVTQVIGRLSIDMVDAPKTSEYLGTRSSRKATEEPRNKSSRNRYGRREHQLQEKLNSPRPNDRSKVERSNSKQRHDGMAFGDKSSSSLPNNTPKPREPLKKLKLIFERMKVFEEKLNSLMTPNQIFPKKNTRSENYCDSDDDVDQLIINPKVHLLSNVERNSNQYNIHGNEYTYKPSNSRNNYESDTSTAGTGNPNAAPFVNNRDLETKASYRANGKPTPAFNITNDVYSNAKAIPDNLPQGNGSNHSIMTLSNGDSSNYSTPASALPNKKLQDYLPSYKKRAIELLESAQKNNAAAKSQSIGNKSNASVEISKPITSHLIKKGQMGSIKPTPSKRKFDASSSDDDGDSSDSGAEANESKKPRLVASVPTQRSHSPATPLANSRSNSTIIQSTNLVHPNNRSNPSGSGSSDTRFSTPQSGITNSFTNTIRKPLLTSLDDLASRGVPDVMENIKSNEKQNSGSKPMTTKYDESSSSDDDSPSDSSDDDDDDKSAHHYKSPKFLSLKVASAKRPKKKKSNLFSTLKR